ncbi:MAG: hypothetical protein CM1200mP22_31590 [Dehalococcoidia bacterium]|nr:MAG: hypothetical protein CM1200mP22_31590 [Dehalococcoidia bacterium]
MIGNIRTLLTSNSLQTQQHPSGNILEFRDPAWAPGLSEFSIDEIVYQA